MNRKTEKQWLESLSTSDLLYLTMVLNGQIIVDENDKKLIKMKRSFEKAMSR